MHAAALGPSSLGVVPFTLLLACMAVLPLWAPRFWEHNRNKALAAAVTALPVVVWLLATNVRALEHSALDYFSFVCLLGSLFVVSGGVHIEGDLKATPATNVALLGAGATLASLIGTTGASMVLIRLVLRTNSERRRTTHLPFFFILLVSNSGGLLTPLGDPPLFLGYLRGVPFFWTLRLLPVWLVTTVYLLLLFYLFDRRAYAQERPEDLALDVRRQVPIRIVGWTNVVMLVGVVLSVFLPRPWREITMSLLAALSLRVGSGEARRKNEFQFGPIVEVAVLFAGIFATMVPALELLREHSRDLSLVAPWHYFIATGMLSSVLDNAPTYLAFVSAAQGLGLSPDVIGLPATHLVAISVGAVLMGANTYVGNGPNFMVKAIADASSYKTLDFVRYALAALLVLTPVYAGVIAYLVLA
jgi:Na+/H+ antiporter NhaD/arsenite permease-like protein